MAQRRFPTRTSLLTAALLAPLAATSAAQSAPPHTTPVAATATATTTDHPAPWTDRVQIQSGPAGALKRMHAPDVALRIVTPDDSEALARLAAEACDDRKAVDIRLIRVEEVSSLADWFVICSGLTDVQVVDEYTVAMTLAAPNAAFIESRNCSTDANCTVSPISMVPLSGCSLPDSMRNRVDLPAPLAPIIPTIAPLGIENDRLSISTRSP